MSATRYIAAPSAEEAVKLLASHPHARLLAGGYQLLLPKDRRAIAGALLIDLGKIPDLAGIAIQPDGNLHIGAGTTIGAIASDAIVKQRYAALADAADLIGDAQVRNRATLGGSLAACQPGADLPALLIALQAQVLLRRPGSSRNVPADEFFTAAGETALAKDEMITGVVLTAPTGRSGMAYEKFKHPATLFALCGVAAAVTLGKDGGFVSVSIGATGALSYPMRLRSVEDALLQKSSGNGALSSIADSLPKDAPYRDDLFGSAEYRRHLLGVLTRRALERAVERAA